MYKTHVTDLHELK